MERAPTVCSMQVTNGDVEIATQDPPYFPDPARLGQKRAWYSTNTPGDEDVARKITYLAKRNACDEEECKDCTRQVSENPKCPAWRRRSRMPQINTPTDHKDDQTEKNKTRKRRVQNIQSMPLHIDDVRKCTASGEIPCKLSTWVATLDFDNSRDAHESFKPLIPR